MIESLYLLQFACFIFMLVNAAFIGLSSLNARWENRRYERSRWMVFFAFLGMACQYLLQMRLGFRASGDDMGAVINMLVYTPCFMLISKAIYNIEATRTSSCRMNTVCVVLYCAIVLSFGIGYWQTDSFRIGLWLYVMLFFYTVSIVYDVIIIIREMFRRRRLLETMTAIDMLPYVRYSHVGLILVCLAALVMPVAILSTTLLYIIGPVILLFLLFFTLNFISLGSSYIPTEELLDSMDDNDGMSADAVSGCASQQEHPLQADGERASVCCNSSQSSLSVEQRQEIECKLNEWCRGQGYKDCSVNMLTLSRSLCINKNDLSQYFIHCLNSTFRIWLSDIRFNAAKKMMIDCPDYSNDVISAECGFSARSQLYRIFKSREGCTPSAWRERNLKV